jgi:predicted kinase
MGQNLLYHILMAKIIPSRPLLIMLYGFPGAGKTYFARQLQDNLQAAHVQGDRIRFELFDQPRYDKQENNVINQLMNYMSEEFLNAGISVIYDINAMRTVQRHALREMARRCHAQPLLIWLQIDNESAYTRASKRDRRRSDDKYSANLDRPTFDRFAGHMQNPALSEEYVVISGKHTFNTQFTAAAKRLRELGLLSIGEDNSKVVKPGLVNLIPAQNSGRVDLSRRNITIR